MFKLTFFVPQNKLETVKDALFHVGAGKIGNYDHCCFQLKGEGQFRPLPGSNPHIGGVGEIEKVIEFRVEMILEERIVSFALEALLNSHPYETPAYDLQRIYTLQDFES